MLRKEIPIVTSPESIVIMKCMQDTGVSSLETDIAYFSPRQQTDDLGLYLSSIAGMSHQGRDFCCTKEPSEALTSFLSRKPGQDGKRARKLDPGTCCCYDKADLPFEIKAHSVDHSIIGSMAYILRGETTVAYTGDFRMHGKNGDATRRFISKAKDASVLIIEGTRAGPFEDVDISEQEVCEACRESIESSYGLVIADFPSDNTERFETFQKIATMTGRELVVKAEDVYLLHNLQSIGRCSFPNELRIYSEVTDRQKRKWEQEVVQPLYGAQYVDHSSIREGSVSNFL
jgi:ribonuclease J